MRELRYVLLLFFSALLSLPIWLHPAQSASLDKQAKKGVSKPIVINSKTLEADNKKKTVTFKADVKAQMENFTEY